MCLLLTARPSPLAIRLVIYVLLPLYLTRRYTANNTYSAPQYCSMQIPIFFFLLLWSMRKVKNGVQLYLLPCSDYIWFHEIPSTAANHIHAELMCAMPVQAEWKRKEILCERERDKKCRERERENDVEQEKVKNGVLPYVASLFRFLIPRNTSTAANQIRGQLQHAVKHEKSEQIWYVCVCVCECGKRERERDTNHIQSAFCLVDRSMIVCVCEWNRDGMCA